MSQVAPRNTGQCGASAWKIRSLGVERSWGQGEGAVRPGAGVAGAHRGAWDARLQGSGRQGRGMGLRGDLREGRGSPVQPHWCRTRTPEPIPQTAPDRPSPSQASGDAEAGLGAIFTFKNRRHPHRAPEPDLWERQRPCECFALTPVRAALLCLRLQRKEAGLGAELKRQEKDQRRGSPGLLTCPPGPRELVGQWEALLMSRAGHLLGRCQGIGGQQLHWDPY